MDGGKDLPLQGTEPRPSSPLLIALPIELSRFLNGFGTDHLYSGFEVLKEVVMKSYVFCNMADYAMGRPFWEHRTFHILYWYSYFKVMVIYRWFSGEGGVRLENGEKICHYTSNRSPMEILSE
jgi:hypothetical protein